MYTFPNVDRVVQRATAEGAKILKPVQDQFYGDRSGFIQDPFGHLWGVATHVEDVSPAGDARTDEENDAGSIVWFGLEAGQTCLAFLLMSERWNVTHRKPTGPTRRQARGPLDRKR